MEKIKTFSDTLTEEQYNRLTHLNYQRKPDHPDEIYSSINFRDLDKSIIGIVASLPIVKFPGSFFDYFLDGDQQFYLVTYKEKVFLVDTQGYNYARYVIQLKDLVLLEKEETQQMKAHPGMAEEIISMLKHMEEQMLRQLFLGAKKEMLWDLTLEKKQLEGSI